MLSYFSKKNHSSRFLYLEGYGENDLSVVSLKGTEGTSVTFEYVMVIDLYNKNIDFNQMHGKALTCKIHDPTHDHPVRYIHGVITRVEQVVLNATNSICTVTLEPNLIFLKIGSSLKTWSNKKTPDLVCELLRQYGITDVDIKLQNDYPVKEFRMQYNESDYDFISRLLEEDGMYYYYTHTDKTHTFVLADHPKSHSPISEDTLTWRASNDESHLGEIYNWSIRSTIIPNEVVCNGYNISQASSIFEKCISTRQANSVSNIVSNRLVPIFSRTELQSAAKKMMSSYESNDVFIGMDTNAPWLSAGQCFNIEVPNKKRQAYRLHHLTIFAENDTENTVGIYEANCIVIENDIKWQPLITYPSSVISGFFNAVVIGPESEEIHTDEFGRVNIRFEWDVNSKNEKNDACWVRVMQPWSGSKFGAQFLPRVGSEVLVGFLQGHPDHPVVVGSVFNGLNKPPYALPANKNESGFVSHSTKAGNPDEGHRLSFNDKKGEEKLTIVSQKDFFMTIKNDRTSEVKGVSHEVVGKNRTTQISKGSDTLTLNEGDMILNIEKGSLQQMINGAMYITIDNGNFNLTVNGGAGVIDLDRTLKISSSQSIEISVNSSKILITPSGITISGPNVKVESSGAAEVKGSMTTVQGSGITQIKGGMINIG